jgi:DNA-3-methyladenine glycosylase
VTTLAEVVSLPAPEAARALLGWTFLANGVGGPIVETEAYAEGDPASHSHRGPTRRNASMFGAPGRLYVYRSYGVHWCANVVCGEAGVGAAVLLRALEPAHGVNTMRTRRGVDDPRLLCSGPGRLTQALAIGADDDGAPLVGSRFALHPPTEKAAVEITPRIGITKAVDVPWRFVRVPLQAGATSRPRA